jgi:hypothetical protein
MIISKAEYLNSREKKYWKPEENNVTRGYTISNIISNITSVITPSRVI